MVVGSPAPSSMADYPTIFRGYIVRSTQDVLARVQEFEGILPRAEREQALHTLSYALKLPEAWPGCRTLLLTMALKMEQAGYRDEWVPYLEQGIHQSRLLDDPAAEAELHFQLGRVYRLRSKYKEARAELETSIKGFEGLNAPLSRARAMNRLAQVARLERQFEEATRLAKSGLTLLEEQDPERAYSNLVLGMVAFDNREWPAAIDLLKISLRLWEKENNQRMIGRSLMSLAAALLPLKRYEEATAVCQRANILFEEIQDPIYQAITRMNLGNIYHYLDQPDRAVALHLQAERVFRQAQDRFYVAHVNHNLGMTYRKLRRWAKAEQAYLVAIDRYQQIGNVAWLVDSMDGLGLSYLEQGQREKAATTFKQALRRLSEIKGEPSYKSYLEMLGGHLQETFNKIG